MGTLWNATSAWQPWQSVCLLPDHSLLLQLVVCTTRSTVIFLWRGRKRASCRSYGKLQRLGTNQVLRSRMPEDGASVECVFNFISKWEGDVSVGKWAGWQLWHSPGWTFGEVAARSSLAARVQSKHYFILDTSEAAGCWHFAPSLAPCFGTLCVAGQIPEARGYKDSYVTVFLRAETSPRNSCKFQYRRWAQRRTGKESGWIFLSFMV